jgi:hypothetical protein
MSYIFTITDLSGTIYYKLKYTPDVEPQFETLIGDNHTWLWNMFEGCLLKDGSKDILYGGEWSIQIERFTEE